MNYLLTGGSGFVAGHLIEAIFKADLEAQVTTLDLSVPDYSFLDNVILNSVRYIKADLTVVVDLRKIIEKAKPHYIIHLAAFSSVAYSWQNPIESFKNNINIFLNLLEAVKQVNPEIRILSVGSSEQYGIVSANKIPLNEFETPNPISPYAVARVAQEYMSTVYVKGYNLNIVITRSFNHFGPRQAEGFVLSGLAKQIVEVKKEYRKPVIYVGNLSIIRDFTDVRDVVIAYLTLLNKGICGEIYNVCSGIGRSIENCLHLLMEIADVKCEIQLNETLTRPVDNPIIVGDNTKIKESVGWFPRIRFEIALKDLYCYWMSKIS